MRWLNLLNANIRKEYIEMKRYLPDTISLFLTFYFIFLAMFFGIKFIGDPSAFEASMQYSIVSYVFWFLSLIAMQSIGWAITNEAMRGTLEQLYMSPMGVWKIMMARMTGEVLVNVFLIVIFLYAAMLTSGQWLHLNPFTTLPIVLLTLISMFGVGFMIAGLAIIFKQIQSLLNIIQFIFMGLTFVPLSMAPYLAFAPFVKGVDMVRTVMIEGLSLTQIPWTDFVVLALNALVYFTLGVWIFLRCERYSMRKGLLGHY
jgi:ABC-2 type transport system permease protein